jgi:predicted  nucleic acid-binding Zn-ribbon protein
VNPANRAQHAAAEHRARVANEKLLEAIRRKAEGRATEQDVFAANAERNRVEGELFKVMEQIEEAEALNRPVLVVATKPAPGTPPVLRVINSR